MINSILDASCFISFISKRVSVGFQIFKNADFNPFDGIKSARLVCFYFEITLKNASNDGNYITD